ncbi:cbb3-type cytochrome c oxidase subunit I [Nostoc sp.]
MTNISVEDITGNAPQQKPRTDWKQYFSFSTDHKVIGIQYIVTAFILFLVGGIFAMIIRGELITPESDLVDRSVYNAMFTMHGTVMLFGWTFTILTGFANVVFSDDWGARYGVSQTNAVAFWMIPIAAILPTASSYPAASASRWVATSRQLQNPTGNLINGQVIWLLAVAISGVSSIMVINFVTTVVKMRAPD